MTDSENIQQHESARKPLSMREAIDAYYLASHAEAEAMLRLQDLLDHGKGSPAQRKEARQLLGLEP